MAEGSTENCSGRSLKVVKTLFLSLGSLPDHPVVAWNVPLQEVPNVSLMPEESTTFRDNQPEVQRTEEPTEDHTTRPGSTTSPSTFHIFGPGPGKPRVAVEEDALDSLSKQGTRSTVVTTGFPVTRQISTVRITTSQASGTSKVAKPGVYHNTHHILTSEEKILASAVVPTSERSPDITSPTTGSSAVQKDLSSLPEGDVTQPEESSGDPVRPYPCALGMKAALNAESVLRCFLSKCGCVQNP